MRVVKEREKECVRLNVRIVPTLPRALGRSAAAAATTGHQNRLREAERERERERGNKAMYNEGG